MWRNDSPTSWVVRADLQDSGRVRLMIGNKMFEFESRGEVEELRDRLTTLLAEMEG